MYSKEKVKQLIKENSIGMFVTQNDEKIFSRPIAYADVDDENNVWFFTDINSNKIDDIINNKNVNFSFADHSNNAYVSLTGKAFLVTDENEINDKWKFFMKAWYPEGKDSERLTLIKVQPETVQYWDGTSSKVIQLYDISKALVTGRSYVDVANSVNEIINY